jgi:hypothetical protein
LLKAALIISYKHDVHAKGQVSVLWYMIVSENVKWTVHKKLNSCCVLGLVIGAFDMKEFVRNIWFLHAVEQWFPDGRLCRHIPSAPSVHAAPAISCKHIANRVTE